MKIGIISDIHSNIDALKCIWNKFEEEKVNKVICIGDIIGIGPYSNLCVQFLIDHKDKLLSCVKGNHEGYLINGIPKTVHNEANGKPISIDEINNHIWNHNQLSDVQKDFLYNLPAKDLITVENKLINIEHYPMNNQNIYKQFYKEFTPDILEDLFENKNSDIYLFGHTHTKLYQQKVNKNFINPGSVGCPCNTNFANACIVDITNDIIHYSDIKVEYNVKKVINEIQSLNYPNNKSLLHIFYNSNLY